MQIGDVFKQNNGEIWTLVDILPTGECVMQCNFVPGTGYWNYTSKTRLLQPDYVSNRDIWKPYTGTSKFKFEIGQKVRVKSQEFIVDKFRSLGYAPDDISGMDAEFVKTSTYNLEVEIIKLNNPSKDLWICKHPDGDDFPAFGWMLSKVKSGTFKQIYDILND